MESGGKNLDIKIAIVDDSKFDIERLAATIRRYFETSSHTVSLFSFSNSEEFLRCYSVAAYNAVFLDIFMDGINGVELGRRLRADDPILAIVFVTGSPDMYSETAPLGMFDYLEKPFMIERVFSLLDRMTAYFPLVREREKKTVVIKIPYSEIQLALSDLICAVANNHITEIYTQSKGMIKSNMKFSDISELLSEDIRFLECNRGIIVNMDHILSMTGNVQLTGGITVPIKIRCRSELLKKYSSYSAHRITDN